MTRGFSIRRARASDGDALARIYNHYVLNSTATFETAELAGADMAARVAKIEGAGLPWLVATDLADDALLAYAYAGPFKERAAWRHCLETSIYVDQSQCGRGLGKALYAELLSILTTLDPGHTTHAPVHTLIGGIALPNPASVALHESIGMTAVGVVRQGGRKFDRWIDVGYWQMMLGEDAP